MKFGSILFFAFTLLAVSSCRKVLDKRDLSALQDDLVFNDSVLARTYVDYIYDQNLPPWGGTSGLTANLADESFGDTKYFEGTLGISDVADFGTSNNANSNYGRIRQMNNFLQEIEKGTLTPTWKAKLKGQVHFFRAWRYWELVKLYGGVPLVLTPLPAVGDENREKAFLPRNKTSECIAQIVSDLNAAIASLPGKWTENNDWGRVTSGAAAALKARVLLYYASQQFNPGDLPARWQAAYDAAVQAKALLSANGFGLNSNYETMWFTERGNPEAVFITGYNDLTGDQVRKNNGYDNSTRPAFAGTGGGSNLPVRELVDAYPMKDGKPINASTKYPYNPQVFYKNRDPRFDKTIVYNGTSWTLNGLTFNRFWIYFSSGSTGAPVGPSINVAVNTSTGFLLRKAINPTTPAGNVQFSGTDWMEIRYAEVLLTLAEAAAGINKVDEAYTELKAIRQRAGLEAGTDGLYGLNAGMDRAQMITAVLNERRIELAFEGKRYWDLRRWKLFESTLNGKRRTGNTITFKASTAVPNHTTFLQVRETMNLDTAYVNNFTIASKNMDTRYTINWKPEYYFFAIPLTAINNNPKLEQTLGWPGGTFDPLQ